MHKKTPRQTGLKLNTVKAGLHSRNKHRRGYDFIKLAKVSPGLSAFVRDNDYGNLSIDFSDPVAVLELNRSLLKYFYGLGYWTLPNNYLCPPVPGRADYIHFLADLMAAGNQNRYPVGRSVRVLDIGTGANCIYPIIGQSEYGWQFLGADIDPTSIENGNDIIQNNAGLKNFVSLKLQTDKNQIFAGIVEKDDYFDLTMCNPPFHQSAEEARSGSVRKIKNLSGKQVGQPVLNFGGQHNELWYEGGEIAFIRKMIRQSKDFSEQVYFFTTLVSKKTNIPAIKKELESVKAKQVRVIDMKQGQKQSRFIAWTFLSEKQQMLWRQRQWKSTLVNSLLMERS